MENNQLAVMLFQAAPILFMFAVLYFVMLRPQQQEQKRRLAMIAAIKKNDDIVTTGGIYGTVVNVKETSFVIRIDDESKMEIEKNAVSYVRRPKE